MIEFELEGRPFVQLNDLIKILGLANSGGQAKLMIADGMASVDGKVELRKRCKIREGQVVEFMGQEITIVA